LQEEFLLREYLLAHPVDCNSCVAFTMLQCLLIVNVTVGPVDQGKNCY